MANEAVLPVPVCAQPSTSFPANATGIAFSCIGVGMLYPFSSIAFKIGSIIFNSLNVIYILFFYRVKTATNYVVLSTSFVEYK